VPDDRARPHWLRTFRQTEDNRYDYSLERRVQDLEALIAHLKISAPITLVMHDWGGMIGMNLRRAAP